MAVELVKRPELQEALGGIVEVGLGSARLKEAVGKVCDVDTHYGK